MTDSELLIKIRSALEAGGLDQAKQKLNELTTSTNRTSTASAAAGKEAANLSENLGRLHRASSGLQQLFSGTLTGTITGLRNIFIALGATIAGVAAAAFVGWKAGTEVFKELWKALVPVTNEVGSIRDRISQLKAGLDKLNETKLDKLKKEFEKLSEKTDQSMVDLGLEQERESTLTQAEQAAQMANLQNLPEHTPEQKEEKQRRIAKLKEFQGVSTAEMTGRHAAQRMEKLQAAKDEEQKKLDQAAAEAEEKEREAERLRQRAIKPSAGEAVIAQARLAQVDAEAAKARLKDLRPVAEKEIAKLSREIYKEETTWQASQPQKVSAMHTGAAEGQAIDRETKERLEKEAKTKVESERQLRLDLIEQEFKRRTKPGELKEMMTQKTALQYGMLPDEMPADVKKARGAMFRKENEGALKERLGELAAEKIEGHKGPQAEAALKAVKKGQGDVIGRILGITESMLIDNSTLSTRLSQLETRSKQVSSQIQTGDRSKY